MYLDDGLGVHDDKELCTQMSIQVKKDIISSGFVPKAEKSMWTPTKNLTFLGTHIDTDKGIFTIPDNRIDKIMSTISDIDLCLTKSDSIDQINFWRFNLHEANVKPFKTDVSWQTIVYSDASNTGYGGYIVENPYNIAHGTWLESEVSTSSTWKELTAVKNVFLSLINFLNGKNVKWFTDNQNVVSIVSKGSTKSVLQKLALDIFSTCIKHNVNIDMVWIPRTENERADYLSRIIDSDDWAISEFVFQIVESLWGPHEVDWFASDDNFKLHVFYSRFWNVNSSGVDAFTVDWRGINGLFVPPVSLIPRVLMYMRQCKAVGTLILPYWPSASFWPMLCPFGDGFISEVINFIDLPTYKNAYIAGKSKKAIFGNVDLTFRMLALRMDFSSS
ncbi:Hypothetical predicted protein [Mytilus galloprovincialis]|uniref:RNase H type-1 domain-containing protein n=1 Tax=Mytilus galloprovincialis TaxID=29158 RepID=A0A8B6FCZ4_MYTGA|nr:Hypothetical predicted protein [Mytilus galloprovincialis]